MCFNERSRTAIIHVLVFLGLFLASGGRSLGLDRRLSPQLGRFAFLASDSIKRQYNE